MYMYIHTSIYIYIYVVYVYVHTYKHVHATHQKKTANNVKTLFYIGGGFFVNNVKKLLTNKAYTCT